MRRALVLATLVVLTIIIGGTNPTTATATAAAKKSQSTTCVGRCGQNDGTSGCQCNTECTSHNDCCSDYDEVCYSCQGRCTEEYAYGAPCYCNSECPDHNNCCTDYDQICNGSGGDVTDDDIMKLTEELYQLDGNNVASDITLDMQGETSSSATNDVASKPLFQSVSASALSGETFKLFEALRDNYNHEEDEPEDNTAQEQAEVSDFLDAVMATALMKKLDQFMTDKSVLPSGSLRENIETIWFTLYSRAKNVLGSSGFEHSFIGELDGSDVGGMHNWVSFYREESAGNIDYKGYIEYADLKEAGYVFTDRFTWYSANKPKGGGYIGTSPEFDLAIYTLCFFTRPNALCEVQVNGVKHNIQTYQLEYGGKNLVGSAYPLVI